MSAVTSPPVAARPRAERVIDVLLLALPTLAIAGPVLAVGAVSALRVLVAVLGVWALLRVRSTPSLWANFPQVRRVIWVSGFWLLWGTVALAWSLSIAAGLKALIALACGLGILLIYIVFLDSARRLMIFFWSIAGALALQEIIAFIGINFNASFVRVLPKLASPHIPANVPVGTLGNPNNLALFLLACLIMLWIGWQRYRGLLIRAVIIIEAVVALVLIYLTGARLVLLAIVAILVVMMIIVWRPILLLGITAFVFWVTDWFASGKYVAQNRPQAIWEVISEVFKQAAAGGGEAAPESSQGTRVRLYINQLWLIRHTWGVGAGPGQFQVWGERALLPAGTGQQTSPHNALGELMADYGVLVALALLLLAWKPLREVCRTLWRARRLRVSPWHMVAIMATVSLPFVSFSQSSFWISNTSWLILVPLFSLPMLVARNLVPQRVRARKDRK